MVQQKIVIIGGGAAGFFAASNIHVPNASITILEKTNKILTKVAISGGGRCNVTNGLYDAPEPFALQYPRGYTTLKKSLHHFGARDTQRWFAERGVPLVMESDGRMFPKTNTSQTIVDCLIKSSEGNGTEVILKCEVQKLRYEEGKYILDTNQGIYTADFVIISAGGAHKLEQWQWLRYLPLEIVPPAPSLFSFNAPKHPITGLMGLSVPSARVKIQRTKYEHTGPLLITHWGFSGPAILKLSALAALALQEMDYKYNISINWLPDLERTDIFSVLADLAAQHGNKRIVSKNNIPIPHRLWEFLITYSGIDPQTKWGEISMRNMNRIINILHNYEVSIAGKTTYKEEFVSAGGVHTSEIYPQTFESRKYKNLFIVGEALDIDGITGGFNFQNAWTGAYLAAQCIIERLATIQP